MKDLINHTINKNRRGSAIVARFRFNILQQFPVNFDMYISSAGLSAGYAIITSIVRQDTSFPGDRVEDPRRPDPPL